MSQPLLPAAASPGTAAALPVAAAAAPGAGVPPAGGAVAPVAATVPVAPVQAAAPVAPAAPTAPAAPATPALSISAHAQQALRLQVFQTLIAQLVTQVQTSNPAMAPQWPTSGVPTALREMLGTLIAQATAGLPQPQQLVAAQPWPQAWVNTVLPAAAPFAAPAPAPAATAVPVAAPPIAAPGAVPVPVPMAASLALPAATHAAAGNGSAAPQVATGPGAAAGSAAALTQGAAGMPPPASAASAMPVSAPRLPPMLTWLVQQGVVQAPDGERGFALTLQVPQAWAQMQAAAMPAAAAAVAPGAGAGPPAAFPAAAAQLQLPFAAPAQQLESGALALVMQGAGPAGERVRTSALLWLDFQPPSAAAGPSSAAAALAGLLPSAQTAQQALATLQARNDPWLQMAALQASGQRPREDERIEERRAGLCTEMGCPYRGKASCVQPFCAEMNRVWEAVRVGGA